MSTGHAACLPVILHMYGLNLTAEVGVLMNADLCGHVSQPPQYIIPCNLLQGALLAQGILGMEPVRELRCLQAFKVFRLKIACQ